MPLLQAATNSTASDLFDRWLDQARTMLFEVLPN